MGFAKHEFKLAKRQKDGVTLREHLESVQKQTGQRPEELDGPVLPPETRHWWLWWQELAEGRQNGFAVSPITWLDIAAWRLLTGRCLDLWDVKAIRSIDVVFVASQNSKGAE